MNKKSLHLALLFDLILFLFFGALLWTINVIGQLNFPGSNLFPFLVRSTILLISLVVCYYLNFKFGRKNQLNVDTLNFKPRLIKYYLGGVLVGCLVLATIWAIVYLIYPFEIERNPYSTVSLAADVFNYGLGNTLEELLFRGFVLAASIKLFKEIGGILFVSLLFGLFHLQGTGLTIEGLTMVMTTLTMSLLFISVIYYTKSIWTAVTLHVTGNLLLHTLGFDGANKGMFKINFIASTIYGLRLTLIYEIVVITFALLLFIKGRRKYKLQPV